MSDKPEAVEVPEAEIVTEEVEAAEPQTQELTVGHMDSMIQVAARVENFAKALDTIYAVIIKRSYEGDWTCHDRQDKPENERKANMGAAAAERIAAFLGITERNWTARKEKADDGSSYEWIHEADFTLGSRTIHAVGQAGSRNKFFGFANGEWKPLDEVSEMDVRTASRRAARKCGVRELLGLRNVPLTKLASLGFDLKKVKMVNFTAKLSDADTKATDDKGLVWKEIKIAGVTKDRESKDPKKPWILWKISDGKIIYQMFGGLDSKRLLKLQMCEEDQTAVKVGIKVGEYNGQPQYSIEKIEGVEESK